ncbi:root meristem growth factor 3, GOLVEN 7 [Hibiscus trionum]|uniref:Root meristem growth factor 3, GOLVEN 7 n=1 Tax=Hibiscus trionum TaxID=183268 RepID=A0A9W7MM55_HIBTR|nr:root meristem growth factor 3, GOLVEN 7 [Hibiscus trionum]
MAAERAIAFLSILVLFPALISFAQANQDSNHETVPTGKELVNAADEHAASKNWLIRGRKLMVQVKKEKMSGGFGVGGSTATKLSQCGGRCEQITVNLSDEADDHQSGFVAFNADYHAPRHHPPKNN